MGSIREKFKKKPSLFYSMSIAATWAGAGSFIVGTKVAQTAGLIPWILWALGNSLTCIVFGLIATKFKKVREVANSRPFKILMGFMAIFQVWVNMGGIFELLEPTVVGKVASYVIVYGLAVFFLFLYMKKSTYRNVMTDNGSWSIVYLLVFALVLISLVANGFNGIPTTPTKADLLDKGWICITLMFGGFFYPTFWELLDYNDKNEDEASKVNMRTSFINGGLLFGFYLLFVLLGACTTYSTSMNLLKAILVSLVAISSLSSFIYAILIDFGKKVGFVINALAFVSWKILVPMGVMGIWTLMQNVRIWMVFGMFGIAIIAHFVSKKMKTKEINA